MREEKYKNILKTIVWCYLIFVLHSPKCAQIQFCCVFFHICQAQEEEGDIEEEIEKFQAVMLTVSKHLHCWPFQHLNASPHSLPWLPLCLPPSQNSNFEILKQCVYYCSSSHFITVTSPCISSPQCFKNSNF